MDRRIWKNQPERQPEIDAKLSTARVSQREQGQKLGVQFHVSCDIGLPNITTEQRGLRGP
jgi:hypothetical protein